MTKADFRALLSAAPNGGKDMHWRGLAATVRLSALCGAVALISGSLGSPAIAQTVQGYIDNGGVYTNINVTGANDTDPISVNSAGNIGGNFYDPISGEGAFIESGGIYKIIGFSTTNSYNLTGINNSNVAIGDLVIHPSLNSYGFYYSNGILSIITPPGATETELAGINNLNQVVGSFSDGPTAARGFIYSGGSYSPVNVGTLNDTFPTSISDSGVVVGHFDTPLPGNQVSPSQGFMLSGGVYTILDAPGSLDTYPIAVNIHGEVAGSYNNGPTYEGFVYYNGTYTNINFPGSVFTAVSGINDAGEVVGDFQYVNGVEKGFIEQGGNYTIVNPPNPYYTFASALNDSGVVVGSYYTSIFALPEPATWAMMLSGFFGLGALLRRARMQPTLAA